MLADAVARALTQSAHIVDVARNGVGLAISIPLIIYGITLVLKVMERMPIIVVAGAGLLGWVAVEMMVTDPARVSWIYMSEHAVHNLHIQVPAICAALVVAMGTAITHTMKISDEMAHKRVPEVAPSGMELSEMGGQAPAM